jgi:hypothetical protein
VGKPRDTPEQQLQQARVAAARRNSRWTELEAVDLVRRGRLLVAASTDALYKPYRGTVFTTGSAAAIPDMAPLAYTVDEDGQLWFYERLHGTWSERVARQDERERRRNAPRETPAWARR